MQLFTKNLALIIASERTNWIKTADGKYGLAVTHWRRAKWQWGWRVSLLLGTKRPFARVTTYSCPMVGTAASVKSMSCVAARPEGGEHNLRPCNLALLFASHWTDEHTNCQRYSEDDEAVAKLHADTLAQQAQIARANGR